MCLFRLLVLDVCGFGVVRVDLFVSGEIVDVEKMHISKDLWEFLGWRWKSSGSSKDHLKSGSR